MDINTIGSMPAFPTPEREYGEGGKIHSNGMTIRDYFAAKALSKVGPWPERLRLNDLPDHEDKFVLYCETAAKAAYLFADAMLKARGK